MDGIASSATAVLLGYISANTNLSEWDQVALCSPNCSPVVAEQFGTLATLYPNHRAELGLGRAPGTDQHTMHYVVNVKKLKTSSQEMYLRNSQLF